MTQASSDTPRSEDRSGFDWESRFQSDDAPWERQGVHPAAQDWVRNGEIKPGQAILTPGCGRSQEPAFLASRGFDVTATDIAPTAIAWQKTRFQTLGVMAEAIETDALAWRPETGFDALYEQTFLCAIHPKRRQDYEAMAHASLKSGGKLLALFMQKAEMGGPPYGCGLDAMRELFADTRWVWPDGEARPYPHPGLNAKAELAMVLIRR
ncbi:Thiopurine S-methyltransferase [Oceanicaulis sp. HTCC2633]|uniref:methyltransferase domain-containing protein n=1 Tax=Oceanicaulis sp. HTCC2633 TaxID=314254 RepID=UPI000066D513|nr:methyltransferase domain-containing protein [Oceanicaulis sp. HTCC2633]EAP91130.1 Thiopurine S-methyltransferase [Oceanicaulis sp. HTCC2633]